VPAGTTTSFRGRTFEATVAPSVPAAGTARLMLKPDSAPGVYTLRMRAAQLSGIGVSSSDLQIALTVGGVSMGQAVTGRLRAAP
jgi:hypothetical protein